MATRNTTAPQIIYWRDDSPESESLAAVLRADAENGQLNCVRTPDQFQAALRHPRTQLIVTHDGDYTLDVMKNVQCRCPDAVVVLVCDDENRLPEEVRAAVSHLLNSRQLDKQGLVLKRAMKESSRIIRLQDFHSRSGANIRDLVQEAVIIQSPDGIISAWNPSAEKLFGWTDAEALGRRRDEVLTILTGPTEAQIDAALETTRSWSGELLYRAKDNVEVFVASRRRQTSVAGERGEVVEVCWDITSEKRGERELHFTAKVRKILRTSATLDQRLALVAQELCQISDACVIDLQNDDGSIQRDACEASEEKLAEIVPSLKGDFPIFSSNRTTACDVMRIGQPTVAASLTDIAAYLGVTNAEHKEKLLAANVVSALAIPVLNLDIPIGVITLLNVKAGRPFTDSDKELVSRIGGMVGSAFERVRSEKRLIEARAQTQSAIYLKDAFLGTVSHELRTPLQAMLGWTHLLRENHLSPGDVERALNSLEESIKAQGKIVNDLLEVSRINSGKLDLAVRPTDLKAIIDESIRSFTTSAATRQVKIDLKLPTTPVWVSADVSWLQRAIWNVLSNSVKFTPIGGTVTIEISSAAGMALLRIIDTGIGIDPKHLPHIFEYFSQADGSTTRSHHGLGIGLAVARHVIEAHGGTIEAVSGGRNQGSTFSISLPLCGPAERVASTGEQTSEAMPARTSSGEDSLDGIRLLLVEDETDTRELLSVALQQAGARVTEASSAAEALQAIKINGFDIIVSDIGMPHEDGCSFIRRVRALPGGSAHIPALALTAYASREDRLNALRAGFQVHMPKPVDIGELLLSLKSLSRSIPR